MREGGRRHGGMGRGEEEQREGKEGGKRVRVDSHVL